MFFRAVASSTFVQSYPPQRLSATIALSPAACATSRSFGATNPATVNPQSCSFFMTAASPGMLFHAMMGKKFGSAFSSARALNTHMQKQSSKATHRFIDLLTVVILSKAKDLQFENNFPSRDPSLRSG